MMKTRLLKVNFALCLICITTLFYATGFADIERTWAIHTCCTDNVTSLSCGATDLLQTDDTTESQDDVRVCVTITKGTTETGWTFTGDTDNDGRVLSLAEQTAFITASTASGKNSFRLVYWKPYADKNAASGIYVTSNTKIAVMDSGNSNTLAHEVGHYAECDDVSTPTHRIMYNAFSTTKNTASSNDKTKYEAKN